MDLATSDQWLAWLEGLHPQQIDLGLDRVAQVWQRMGLSLGPAKVITIGGTNGKGSAVALLEAIGLAAGYRVCAYRSPHLLRYHERIRFQGQDIDEESLCQSFAAVEQVRGETSLTYFEFGTLAALNYFAWQQPDWILLEVGLGGRLDAVNLIDPDVALITSIDYDHQDWLGESLDQIAREKAGILRPDQPAVFGGGEPPQGLLDVAEELGANLLIRDRDYHFHRTGNGWAWSLGSEQLSDLPLPALPGAHQLANAAAVLAALTQLSIPPIPLAVIQQGLEQVRLPGRLQSVPGEIEILLDVAHNPDAAQVLAAYLADHPVPGRTQVIFAMLADKDLAAVAIQLAPWVSQWHLMPLDTARGMTVPAMASMLENLGIEQIYTHESPKAALASAQAEAQPGDRILVTGSFYSVAAVMGLL